jgi:arylsulfatase
MFVRWPSQFEPGTVINDTTSAVDWVPTLMAAAGRPEIKDELKEGTTLGDKEYKVYLDGYNILPNLAGASPDGTDWPRREFFYWNDGGQLVGLRYDDWKLVFMEQREKGFMVWSEPFVPLRIPKIFNLRTDPFERADTDANNYENWWIRRVFALVPAQTFVAEYIDTFKEFPPRQKPAKFNVDSALATLKAAPSN